jgi:glycosyltransferase involved in cell wall biosynthesis
MADHVEPVIKAEKKLWEEAPLVIANSGAIVRDLAECYESKMDEKRISFVPHGLTDLAADQPAGRADETKEKCRILFVGRFEERKGIDVLLEILPDILSLHPEVEFELTGGNDISSFWANFQKKYALEPGFNRISAPGCVSTVELSSSYQSCDICVAPSRYESFGLIYLEAMMWGKPCIGTTAGGIPEIVRDGENGLTAIPGDAKSLKKILLSLIEDNALRASMGQKSREIFLAEYTQGKMIRSFTAAINNFLNDNS